MFKSPHRVQGLEKTPLGAEKDTFPNTIWAGCVGPDLAPGWEPGSHVRPELGQGWRSPGAGVRVDRARRGWEVGRKHPTLLRGVLGPEGAAGHPS